MRLIRDCLDKQLVDKHGKPMGRVDGLVFEWSAGNQPKVTQIEVGSVVQWRRVNRRFSDLVDRIRRWIGVGKHDPCFFPWEKSVSTAIEVVTDVEAEKSGALDWEIWLRKNIIMKIPGA